MNIKFFTLLTFFFALITLTMADGCEQSHFGKCGDNDNIITKQCCSDTQSFPVYYNPWSFRCIHAFGQSIDWNKFQTCCTSHSTIAQCQK
jgi:hypothetical protein